MERPAALPFKDRKVALVVFGLLEILVGLCCANWATGLGRSAQFHAELNHEPVNYRRVIPDAVLACTLSATFISLGIGSMLCRRWARTLTLVLARLWLMADIILIVAVALLVPQWLADKDPDFLWISVGLVLVMACWCLVSVALPSAFVFFYGRPNVRATCESRDPVPRWTDAVPSHVLGAALTLALGASTILLTPIGYRPVFPFFGTLLVGPSALALTIVVGLAGAWLAWGIVRVRRSAWATSIAVIVALGFSATITMLRVDVLDFYRAVGHSEARIEGFKRVGFLPSRDVAMVTALAFCLLLGYLLSIKKYLGGRLVRDVQPE